LCMLIYNCVQSTVCGEKGRQLQFDCLNRGTLAVISDLGCYMKMVVVSEYAWTCVDGLKKTGHKI
jgi:hypothetical protein